MKNKQKKGLPSKKAVILFIAFTIALTVVSKCAHEHGNDTRERTELGIKE